MDFLFNKGTTVVTNSVAYTRRDDILYAKYNTLQEVDLTLHLKDIQIPELFNALSNGTLKAIASFTKTDNYARRVLEERVEKWQDGDAILTLQQLEEQDLKMSDLGLTTPRKRSKDKEIISLPDSSGSTPPSSSHSNMSPPSSSKKKRGRERHASPVNLDSHLVRANRFEAVPPADQRKKLALRAEPSVATRLNQMSTSLKNDYDGKIRLGQTIETEYDLGSTTNEKLNRGATILRKECGNYRSNSRFAVVAYLLESLIDLHNRKSGGFTIRESQTMEGILSDFLNFQSNKDPKMGKDDFTIKMTIEWCTA